MYFWKYWRDTRRGVFIYIGLLVSFAAVWLIGMYRVNRIDHIGGDAAINWAMDLGVAFALSYMCALVMGLTTGTNSAGADIGRGTGDFLLTRPRSRRYFVWAGWVTGIVELFGLISFTALLSLAGTTFATGPVWRQSSDPGHFQFDGQQILNLPLILAMVLLTAAVIFGLTYFCTILFRSGQRGLISSLAVLFGYSIGSSLLKDWARISLPSLNFDHASLGPNSPWYQAAQLHVIGWTLVALAFPLAAQVIFERRDI
jgi:ABC-type transport system involved in multi-copper enzyme maturation permease subunit